MSLCKSIETLSMAYLDDELAAEERHELDAHLAECPSCRAHLEGERADISMVRRALVGRPLVASDTLRARVMARLDQEDRVIAKRRWSRYMLPASSIVAAAAAIAVFVGVQARHQISTRSPSHVSTFARSAAQVGRRPLPLEVQGPSTPQWLHQHFAADLSPPSFEEPTTQLIGARLLPGAINGHDGAALRYLVDLPGRPSFQLLVLVVRDLHGDELRDGNPVRANGRTLYVFKTDEGVDMVSYVPRPGMGFLFMAPELTAEELIGLASSVNLVSE